MIAGGRVRARGAWPGQGEGPGDDNVDHNDKDYDDDAHRTRKLFERRGLSPSSAPASTESDANNTARSLEDIMRYDA